MLQYSFIIPVYKCEKYLNACVQSILEQDINNEFEVILYPFADICQIVLYKLSQPPERDYLQRDYKPWRENYYESYPGGIAQEEGEEISVQDKKMLQENMKNAYYENIQKIKQQEAIQHTFKENEVLERKNAKDALADVKENNISEFRKVGNYLIDIDSVEKEINYMEKYINEQYASLDYDFLTKHLKLAKIQLKKRNIQKAKEELRKGGRPIVNIAMTIGCLAILKWVTPQ